MTLLGSETWVDLIILNMVDFDVIFSMDLLSPYPAFLNCYDKIVTLTILGVLRLEWMGSLSLCLKAVISFLCAHHIVEKGCLSWPMCAIPMLIHHLPWIYESY